MMRRDETMTQDEALAPGDVAASASAAPSTPTGRKRAHTAGPDELPVDDAMLLNALDGSPSGAVLGEAVDKKRKMATHEDAKSLAASKKDIIKNMKPVYWIETLAKNIYTRMTVKEFVAFQQSIEKFDKVINGGSQCSGSEVEEVVANRAIQLVDPDAVYKSKFVCDKAAMKVRFISGIVHNEHDDEGASCCKFKEMSTMSGSRAECSQKGHKSPCIIPSRLPFHGCGWSCKDLSKLKTQNRRAGNPLKGDGTTGITFRALIAFLTVHSPFIYFGENLEDIAKEDSELSETLDEDFQYIQVDRSHKHRWTKLS
jgi:hypothetical protein